MMAIAFMVVTNFGAWAQADARTDAGTQNARTLKLNVEKVELTVGDTMELKVEDAAKTASSLNASNDAKTARVEWKSSNKEIVTVDAKGVIRGVKEGKATVTASSGGKEGKCEVVVVTKEKKAATRN